MSAHVHVERDTDCHAARRKLEVLLHERFELDRSTRATSLLELEMPEQHRRRRR
jgi:hypothetical protein